MSNKKPKRLRLSWSLIHLWERGDVDGAVQTYFHLDRPITQQMKDGKRIHEEIADYIDKFNTIPDWLIDYPLELPETERIITVSYNELFDLKCIVDCLDITAKTLFEWKTGVSSSLDWAGTGQIPMYFLIAELAGIVIDRAFLVRYNQYIKESDFCIIHNNKALREKARNTIDSCGPEIYTFFEKQGLL